MQAGKQREFIHLRVSKNLRHMQSPVDDVVLNQDIITGFD